MVDPQPFKARITFRDGLRAGLGSVAPSWISGPELGGYKQVSTFKAFVLQTSGNTCSYGFLVLVPRCCIVLSADLRCINYEQLLWREGHLSCD